MKLPALTHVISRLRRSFATIQAALVTLWVNDIHPLAYAGGTLKLTSDAGSFMRAHSASANEAKNPALPVLRRSELTKISEKLIRKFLEDSVAGKVSVDEQVEFLENFTPEKVGARDLKIFAEFMLENVSARLNMPGAIDICGTGGSGLERINTSTIAAFLLADLGVKVAKHGNKAASGRFGSFDLLEELEVDLSTDPRGLLREYDKNGLAFIYARNFHPVMKHFVEARKKIGKPTIFNILGPLLNPANVQRQIIGTGFEAQMRLIAEACKLLGKEQAMVVCGCDGLDEVTLTGSTKVVELKNGQINEYEISPNDFGVNECSFEEISGGNKDFNVKIANEILEGRCETRHSDLVYVNMALALRLAGVENDLKKGYALAKRGNILKKIARTKVLPSSKRSFYKAIAADGLSVIAEIKKASPSSGNIFEKKFDARKIAAEYEKAGASAISVLTDEKFFKGSFEYLREASEACSLPILCKDFIVNEGQIYKAREFGADAILLIAGLLSVQQIDRFIKLAESLGMDALVETHDKDELDKVLQTKARIIGINNRNLKTFEIDLGTTNELCELVPEGRLIVSESGISSREDVKNLDKKVDGILVGTALMKSNSLTNKLHELSTDPRG